MYTANASSIVLISPYGRTHPKTAVRLNVDGILHKLMKFVERASSLFPSISIENFSENPTYCLESWKCGENRTDKIVNIVTFSVDFPFSNFLLSSPFSEHISNVVEQSNKSGSSKRLTLKSINLQFCVQEVMLEIVCFSLFRNCLERSTEKRSINQRKETQKWSPGKRHFSRVN